MNRITQMIDIHIYVQYIYIYVLTVSHLAATPEIAVHVFLASEVKLSSNCIRLESASCRSCSGRFSPRCSTKVSIISAVLVLQADNIQNAKHSRAILMTCWSAARKAAIKGNLKGSAFE